MLLYNRVKTRDNRFQIWESDKKFEFFQIDKKLPWEGSRRLKYQNVSTDGGKSFKYVGQHAVFGTFFFLHEDLVIISRTVFNILDLFSNVGGLLQLLRVCFCLRKPWNWPRGDNGQYWQTPLFHLRKRKISQNWHKSF